jgi:hypothetical protein
VSSHSTQIHIWISTSFFVSYTLQDFSLFGGSFFFFFGRGGGGGGGGVPWKEVVVFFYTYVMDIMFLLSKSNIIRKYAGLALDIGVYLDTSLPRRAKSST